ncbi:hypothetical protein [Chryseobacterium hispalense]|uniref:hypothetical protein n=1 Tax=Chryseobacterium hispalense TaxID=1453492 RepID=UPI00391981BC
MKHAISILAFIGLFTLSFAQDTHKDCCAGKDKKECSVKDKKSCSTEHKSCDKNHKHAEKTSKAKTAKVKKTS